MTMPSGDHEVRDIEVPLRLQPVVARPEGWRGRSINLIAVGLVGFVVIGVLLSTAFGNSGPSSPASGALAVASGSPGPTARPTRRPTPIPLPLATPLPTIEVHGTARPSERRLVYVDGPDLLDLGSGTMRSLGRTYEDVFWPAGSEYVCICVVRSQGAGSSAAVTLQFGRFDETGERLVETDLVAYDDVVAVPETTEGFNIAATMDAAGDHLLVVVTARRPPVWIVELHIVDVDTGSLLDSAVIDSFPVDLDELRPSASPRMDFNAPDGVYAGVNAVAATPDGKTVFVRVGLFEVLEEAWTSRNLEWFVPIGDGTAGEPLPMPEDAQLAPDRWCIGRPTFVDAERLVQVCGQPPQPGDGFWSVRRLTTAGKSLGDLPIGAVGEDASAAAAPLVDRERRAVYLWDSFRHLVGRVDIDTGSAQQGLVDDPAVRGGGSPFGPAGSASTPVWCFRGTGRASTRLGLKPATAALAGPPESGSSTPTPSRCSTTGSHGRS